MRQKDIDNLGELYDYGLSGGIDEDLLESLGAVIDALRDTETERRMNINGLTFYVLPIPFKED